LLIIVKDSGGSVKVTPARVVFSAEDRAEIARQVEHALETGSLTLGPATRRLEEAFAARHQAPHAVAVASGTAALEIILRAVGVSGREVVVPANTFFATAAAVVHAGGVPVFADVDRETMALSPESLQTALSKNTAAVIHVHIGGLIAPSILTVADICAKAGVPLIEDAAHAHGSSLGGRHAGSFGVAAAFSFYPTKVITSGEGGAIVTTDDALADEARIYRDQGKAGFLGNVHVREGYAWRMSEVHAAIGEVHLRRLDEFLAHRRHIAAKYDVALVNTPVTLLAQPSDAVNNYYKYIALLPEGVQRADVKRIMREQHEVGLSGEVYELPLHSQPVFDRFVTRSLPVSEDVCARHICLPLHSDMTDAEADLVVDALGTVLEEVSE
jgi:perosamine synthetase